MAFVVLVLVVVGQEENSNDPTKYLEENSFFSKRFFKTKFVQNLILQLINFSKHWETLSTVRGDEH